MGGTGKLSFLKKKQRVLIVIKTKNDRESGRRRLRNKENIFLSQKPAIIIVSINKLRITSVSVESTGSSCITDSMDIWHEMLMWSSIYINPIFSLFNK